MDYYRVTTTGDLNETSLCLVEDEPESVGLYGYCMARGVRIGDRYPAKARIKLREESPGIKLAGFLGNTIGYFIVTQKAKEIILRHCPNCEFECLPFTLYNKKGRIHSNDYIIINPIGGFDCLKEDACGIAYDKEGKIVTIEKYVLDRKKLTNAPELFRVHKVPSTYVMGVRVAKELRENGVMNLKGKKLVIAD